MAACRPSPAEVWRAARGRRPARGRRTGRQARVDLVEVRALAGEQRVEVTRWSDVGRVPEPGDGPLNAAGAGPRSGPGRRREGEPRVGAAVGSLASMYCGGLLEGLAEDARDALGEAGGVPGEQRHHDRHGEEQDQGRDDGGTLDPAGLLFGLGGGRGDGALALDRGVSRSGSRSDAGQCPRCRRARARRPLRRRRRRGSRRRAPGWPCRCRRRGRSRPRRRARPRRHPGPRGPRRARRAASPRRRGGASWCRPCGRRGSHPPRRGA